jgi:hypothetical protein
LFAALRERRDQVDRGFFFIDYPADNGIKRLLTSNSSPPMRGGYFPNAARTTCAALPCTGIPVSHGKYDFPA